VQQQTARETMKRCISHGAAAIALLCYVQTAVSAAPPPAVDRKELLAPVDAWVHAFSSQQAAFPSDAFTEDCTVIDEFPPFAWGPGGPSVRVWYAAVEGMDAPANRASVLRTKETVLVGLPENLQVQGNRAYMTFHAVWSGLSRKGKRFSQRGLFTVAERKTTAGWRIFAHSWGILPSSR
jgi:ketosteroid isomerase-like protein